MTPKITARAAFGTMRFRASVTAGLIMLIAAGTAHAKDNDNNVKECSKATLDGLYAFHASGFNIVAGVPQPKAIVELIQFNGNGGLTVPAATVSINGVVTRSSPGGTGSYTVGPDCIGSLAFGPPGPTFDLFVGFRETELYMIQTGPGSPVLQGTLERLSR